jgi:hypothetical protein
MSTITYADETQRNFDTSKIAAHMEWKNERKDPTLQFLRRFLTNHTTRRMLPYGKWTCADGREVVFNREYQPIFQRKDGVVSHADRNEYVKNIVKTEMYYDDGCAPATYLDQDRGYRLSKRDTAHCQRSILICLMVMDEFTPPEHDSVSRQWTVK